MSGISSYLFPLGNEVSICILFSDTKLINRSCDLSCKVHIENIARSLMIQSKYGPKRFILFLSIVRISLGILYTKQSSSSLHYVSDASSPTHPHLHLQLIKSVLKNIKSFRNFSPTCPYFGHSDAIIMIVKQKQKTNKSFLCISEYVMQPH